MYRPASGAVLTAVAIVAVLVVSPAIPGGAAVPSDYGLQPPTDGSIKMVVIGDTETMEVVWVSEDTEITTPGGEVIIPRWVGQLTATEEAEAHALIDVYVGDGVALASGGWICTSRQPRPRIRTAPHWDVAGYMSQKCSGPNADEHQVDLRLQRWDEYDELWWTRTSGTSEWFPANGNWRGYQVGKECSLSTTRHWRTTGEGTLRLTNGQYRYLPTFASAPTTGSCSA